MLKVRLYSHVGQLSGFGRAGADLAVAMLATGRISLEVRCLNWNVAEADVALTGARAQLRDHLRQDHELTEPDLVIVNTLPLSCAQVHELACDLNGDVDERLANKPWIVATTWEGLTAPPSVISHLDMYDQVWTPSSFARDSLRAPSEGDDVVETIKVIPHAFDPATLEQRRANRDTDQSRARIDGRDRYIFNWGGAWTSRKNPAGLLRAWAMAFRPDDQVELKIHSPGSQEAYAVAFTQTGLQKDEMAPISITTAVKSDEWLWGWHATSDCYVTAARGEAWNLPAFDAMLAGKHLIVPTPSGSDEYLAGTTAWRYPGFRAPAGVDVRVVERMQNGLRLESIGAQGLTSRCEWLEPDLVALARCMRRAYDEKIRSLDMDYDPVERYGFEAVGKLALDALEEL